MSMGEYIVISSLIIVLGPLVFYLILPTFFALVAALIMNVVDKFRLKK